MLIKIKELLAKGHIEQALSKSLELAANDPFLLKQVIVLSSKFNQIKNQEITGIISFDNSQLTKNQIVASLLEIIQNIEPSYKDSDLNHENNVNYSEWTLTKKFEFVDLLLNCSSLQQKEGRDEVVNGLPNNVKTRISRNNQPRMDIKNILDTCSNFSGVISTLISNIRTLEGDTNSMLIVYQFLYSKNEII